MCDYVSFVVTKDGRLLTGDLYSHSGIERGWDLKPGEYREAEWVDEGWDSLRIRIQDGDDATEWYAAVLAVCPNRTRKELLRHLAHGRSDGKKYWYRDGELHRDDGPAEELADGTKYWYRDGELHRDDGPAVEYANGTKYWFRDGDFIKGER